MDTTHQEALALLEDDGAPFAARHRASRLIADAARAGALDRTDAPLFYEALVMFWKEFGQRRVDRGDKTLFPIRKALAGSCSALSALLPGGRRFYTYYPRLPKVEGPHDQGRGGLLRGALTCTYGTSLYEFHWEYPIRGFGVRKDLISVIADDDTRLPLLEWCEAHDIIVVCNRCGLEITFEVSRDCPWRTAERSDG